MTHPRKGGDAYELASITFLIEGGLRMKNNDYRRYIIDMINHIHSNTALKEIYSFVQKFFLRK